MKFSEFVTNEGLLTEKNEGTVLSVLKKNMQPALDKAEKILNDRLGKWGINKKVGVYSKEKEIQGGYEVGYWLEVPKDLRVDDAKDFSNEAHKAFKEVGRRLEKVLQLPFFVKRWDANFGILEVSGRGPWKVAQIIIRENPNFNRGDPSAEDRNLFKDDRGFSALRELIDEISLYKNGERVLELSNKAGRISPDLVKEAKKLVQTIKDFKNKAETEIKKLASQHPDSQIQRYYS